MSIQVDRNREFEGIIQALSLTNPQPALPLFLDQSQANQALVERIREINKLLIDLQNETDYLVSIMSEESRSSMFEQQTSTIVLKIKEIKGKHSRCSALHSILEQSLQNARISIQNPSNDRDRNFAVILSDQKRQLLNISGKLEECVRSNISITESRQSKSREFSRSKWTPASVQNANSSLSLEPLRSDGFGDNGMRRRVVGNAPFPGGSQLGQIDSLHIAQTRRQDMKEVLTTVLEIGETMTKTAALVEEQGEMLDRIDADMDIALENIKSGNLEIGKVYERVMRHRSFALKLFAVLLFVVILFFTFKGNWRK